MALGIKTSIGPLTERTLEKESMHPRELEAMREMRKSPESEKEREGFAEEEKGM